MQRSQIKTYTRALLRDNNSANYKYPDAILDPLLNEAAYEMQSRYLRIDPFPQTAFSTANIVAGQYRYLVPNDIRTPGVVGLEFITANGAVDWKSFTNARYEELEKFIRGAVVSANTRPQGPLAAVRGMTPSATFLVYPAFSQAVTNGLRIEYVPLAAMSADTDIPPIPLGLHVTISLRTAKLFGLTYDADGKDIEQTIDKLFDEWEKSFKYDNGDVQQIGLAGGVDRSRWADVRGSVPDPQTR